MCINPQQRQAIFREIVEALKELRRLGSFSENLDAFKDLFIKINQAHNLEYDQEVGQNAQCIFFFPFSAQSAHWEGSIEILKSTSHYTIFDRHGRFSIYSKSRGKFGSIVVTNSPDEAIAKLEDLSAVDFLSNIENYKSTIARLKEQNDALSLNIDNLHKNIDTISSKLNMNAYQHVAAICRRMKFWSKN